ncbi:MAG: hypothetical protein NZ656_01860 [Nitrospinaceae bacterium]|nr:hypothetical protein [Nitrospinaceae bacterium]
MREEVEAEAVDSLVADAVADAVVEVVAVAVGGVAVAEEAAADNHPYR